MGRLLYKNDIDDAPWFFEDAYYSHEGRRYMYEWPSSNFPYCVAIHSDNINNKIRIRVRKWIELNLQETVIFDILKNDYRWYWHKTIKDWDHSYEVGNSWLRFHFENEQSAMMFRLAFSEIVKTPTKHHPKNPEHEEWCNMTPGQRAERGY
jgi:hypothetical protein